MKTIGLFAPSGFVADPAIADRAERVLRAAGYAVKRDPALGACATRFAGSDDERLAAIYRIADDPGVDVALALRGGYGISRLLDRLDFARIARAAKLWVGMSDFTAFQTALFAKTGQASLHGPMVGDFGREVASAFALAHFDAMLQHGQDVFRIDVAQPHRDSASGRLWGGNLTMLCHLLATPFWPECAGEILFIEDVAEAPYRVDRMLHQLDFAGVLRRQKAILFGDFGGYRLGATDNGFDLDAVIRSWRQRLAVPIFTGLPFGHIPDKLSLPIGGEARVAADECGWELEFALSER
ncbi:LD-carboxypeptidase [Niveibacterium terrae]|uniref:LD-carboxypeptidase n=1 Tax=Niveibacterium terrae TaxID=3373598 RepID=UPI003A93F659